MSHKWIVITGGPSCGKTTLITRLADMGYAVVPEAARAVIDDGFARGLTLADIRSDETAFQMEILRRKIETERTLDPSVITFFDRGMHDTIAYMRTLGLAIPDEVYDACKKKYYGHVFVPDMDTYTVDYARSESEEEARAIHADLGRVYAEYDIAVTPLPWVSVEERIEMIRGKITAL